jgi:HD superfamily phosphohydrolase
MTEYEVVRDPLWDNIRIDAAALDVLDTPAMQRLRYVRQLGHAFLVYPGATHTRFEHALGAYHLTRRALANLNERGELAQLDESQRMAARLAALTHDIGHYPFSHTLEEAGFPKHEQLGVAKLGQGELAVLLQRLGGNELVSAIGLLITGQSHSPLKGLISGSLDLDKIDYLSRDARMCGVPYGAVDVDRLLASLALVETDRGRLEVGVLEKGISAVESLLFAKYQMYRNVYWHHAVRSATCMFKRAVRAAECSGGLSRDTIAEATDDGLTEKLLATDPTGLARAVHRRRLYKRSLDIPASEGARGSRALDSGAAGPARASREPAREGNRPRSGRTPARFPQQPFHAGDRPSTAEPQRRRGTAHRTGERGTIRVAARRGRIVS